MTWKLFSPLCKKRILGELNLATKFCSFTHQKVKSVPPFPGSGLYLWLALSNKIALKVMLCFLQVKPTKFTKRSIVPGLALFNLVRSGLALGKGHMDWFWGISATRLNHQRHTWMTPTGTQTSNQPAHWPQMSVWAKQYHIGQCLAIWQSCPICQRERTHAHTEYSWVSIRWQWMTDHCREREYRINIVPVLQTLRT